MKASGIFSCQRKDIAARHATQHCLAAVMVVLLGISCDIAICRAQSPDNDVPGAEVLTRGPVHEAFAGMVTFNPEPGVVISKAPPDVIEEVPPEERPAGDNVSWIPGYWAWDDERSDFMWISGTWRALPPGREWLAGYWAETAQGHQWISGYWADAAVRDTTYLPPPPATVEVGPNIAAPSADYGWTPGCWIWYQGRYAWRPGYWAQGRADWDWIPAHYVWTPRGHIFVGGYWDYSVERRGILFAPVYFAPAVYARRGYHYSPTIVISLGVFNDHLFLRPRYHHYYFGDYYAPSYHQVGFYASFSFQSSRHGYDPFYSRQRWEHRGDRDWEHRAQASYQNRRDHQTARPPRTWAAQRNIRPDPASSQPNRMPLATPINQLARRKDSPMQFQPVAREERLQLAQRGQEVQKSREQRRTIEASAVVPTGRAPVRTIEPTAQAQSRTIEPTTRTPGRTAEPTARAPASGRSIEPTIQTPGRSVEPAAQAPSPMEPTRVQIPRSPIVAKPANQLAKNHTPPQAQQAPEPDLKLQPKSAPPGRQPNANQSNPQPQPRKPESEKRPPPGRSEATPAPREKQVQPQTQPRPKESGANAPDQLQRNAKAAERATQLESQQRANEATAKAQQESEQNARGLETRARQESEQRAKDVAVKAQEEAQRNARGLEAKVQQESERRARDAAVKTAEDSQRNARASEARARQESQQRSDDAAVKAREGPQRNASRLEKPTQQVSQPSVKRHPGTSEKGATKLLRKDPRTKGQP